MRIFQALKDRMLLKALKKNATRKHQYDPITEARLEEQRRCWVETRRIIERMEAEHRQERRNLCNDISRCLTALDRAGVEWPIKAPQVETPKGWKQ